MKETAELLVLGFLVLAAFIIWVGPVVLLWAINNLVYASGNVDAWIPLTFRSWACGLVIMVLLGSSKASYKRK